MNKFRAKMVVAQTVNTVGGTELKMQAVINDGSEENKSFSKHTPSADLSIQITNEELLKSGVEPGQQFYVDFTPISAAIVG